jgi:hypothetical protein
MYRYVSDGIALRDERHCLCIGSYERQIRHLYLAWKTIPLNVQYNVSHWIVFPQRALHYVRPTRALYLHVNPYRVYKSMTNCFVL